MDRNSVFELYAVEGALNMFDQQFDLSQLLRRLLIRVNSATEIAIALWAVFPVGFPRRVAVATFQRWCLLLHNKDSSGLRRIACPQEEYNAAGHVSRASLTAPFRLKRQVRSVQDSSFDATSASCARGQRGLSVQLRRGFAYRILRKRGRYPRLSDSTRELTGPTGTNTVISVRARLPARCDPTTWQDETALAFEPRWLAR